MAKLKLATGVKSYEIEEQETGRILGTIYINTNDMNIGQRALDAQKKIDEYIKESESIAVEANTDEEAIAQLTVIDKQIKEQLDYLFDSPVSETVFKGLHCLNLNKGKYFIESFLDMIMPVINTDLQESIKASEKRISKYTSQVK